MPSASLASSLAALSCLAVLTACGGAEHASSGAADATASDVVAVEAGLLDASVDTNALEEGSADAGGSCSYGFPIPATAANSGCVFSPSDVACDASADCRIYLDVGHCLCVLPAWGVNASNDGGCGAPPPCAPTDECAEAGLLTEDCKIVSSQSDITVSCVAGRCMTRASE